MLGANVKRYHSEAGVSELLFLVDSIVPVINAYIRAKGPDHSRRGNIYFFDLVSKYLDGDSVLEIPNGDTIVSGGTKKRER